MFSSPSDKRGISALPSSSSWTHTFMPNEFNVTGPDQYGLTDTRASRLVGKNDLIYPSWKVILLVIWKKERSSNLRCLHTNKEDLLKCISNNTCTPTQVSHDPSFHWSILTVLLQVDYKRPIRIGLEEIC